MQVFNWQAWVALIVSALLLLLLVYRVDLGELQEALRQANYIYVVPAIALYFVAVYFRATRWRYLLSPLRAIPVVRLYPVVIIGYMANNLLPARLGEVVRSYYLAQREQFNTSTALATIAVERVYDGVTLLAFAALAAPVLLLLGEFDGASGVSRTAVIIVSVATVGVFLAGLVFLSLLATQPQFVPFIQRALNIVPTRWGRAKAQGFVFTFVQGLSILNSPRKHLGLFVLSLPVWFFEGSMYYLVSYSFGIDGYFGSVGVLILVVMLVTATSNLVTAIPTAIGGIGPFEIVSQQTLVALGVGASVAAAYAGFLHLVALWLPVNLVGLALLWRQNLSLRQLAAARRTPAQESQSPHTAFSKGGQGGTSPLSQRGDGGITIPQPGEDLT